MFVHKLVLVNTSQTVHLKGKYISIPTFLYTCKAAAHGRKKKTTLHISLKGSRQGNKKGLRIMASELIQPQ